MTAFCWFSSTTIANNLSALSFLNPILSLLFGMEYDLIHIFHISTQSYRFVRLGPNFMRIPSIYFVFHVVFINMEEKWVVPYVWSWKGGCGGGSLYGEGSGGVGNLSPCKKTGYRMTDIQKSHSRNFIGGR